MRRGTKFGAALIGAGLSISALGAGKASDPSRTPDVSGGGGEATAMSRQPQFTYGGRQPAGEVIEVRAKVVDVRGETMFLNTGGPVVRAELGGVELKRTLREGEDVVVHLVRGDGLKNLVAGVWTEKG